MENKSCMSVVTIILLLTSLIPLSAILFPKTLAAPTAPDLYEPDNILENATVLTNDQLQQHNIYPVGDVDWLELRIDGVAGVSTKTTIETFGSSGDTDMTLYNPDLTRTLAHNDDKNPSDYFSKISIYLTPGIYYIKVEGKSLVFDYSVIASFGRMFQTTYGTSGNDYGESVQQTADGGYVITGYSKSTAGYTYLLKTDASGSVQWQNTYGGFGYYYDYSVQQTSDAGYIVAGTFTFNNYIAPYLLKTDASGNMQWNRTYVEYGDTGYSAQQTSDGGYILAGSGWFSTSGSDVCLIKTDSNGNVQWHKNSARSGDDEALSVRITSDGGYIAAGYSKSSSGIASVYLVKTDSSGNIQWQNTYGGSGYFYGNSVEQTSDGGYIVAGEFTFNNYFAPYVLKTDASGNMQWNKTYHDYGTYGYSAQQISDGGYILAGSGYYSSGMDAYLAKLDSGGNVQWQKTYGGSRDDEAFSVRVTSDGGYVFSGHSASFSADGTSDVYLVKTDQSGYSPLNRDVVIDEGTSLIPQVVYTVLSDPPGDGSYNDLVKEKTTSWDFTLSAQTTVSVGYEAEASFLGSGVSASTDFSLSLGGSDSRSVEVTTSQQWSSNTISNDGHYIGPGYGDTYVGDAWLLHWRVIDRTFPNNTHANVIEYGPTTETGFMLSAYQIKNGAVPEPYKSQMLALNPADDNYISNDEARNLAYVETETISGGIPYDESYSRAETSTRAFTFNARMSSSTAAKLGFSFGPIDASGKVTVTFSFDMGISYLTSTTTKTRAGFHIYDDDGADRYQVTVWYNPVFGTYLFNASGHNIGLPGTSNPRELWDNRAPTASNVRIVPSSPKRTDTMTLLYDYSDPDGDPESGMEIWWYKGIYHQAIYDNQHQIPAGVSRKGETWIVVVHPSDGIVFGNWQQSTPTVIVNSPPTASDVRIIPHNPLKTDGLTAHYLFSDADGDPESGTQIRWYKNAVLQTVYNDLLTVPQSALKKGDVWYFTVQPKDGTEFGSLQTSPTETIQNSAPTASNVHVAPDWPLATDNLGASYNYNDVDGDIESGTQIRWYMNGVLKPAYNNLHYVPSSALANGQKWNFTVQPKDGTLLGSVYASNTVEIGQTITLTLSVPQAPAQGNNTDGSAREPVSIFVDRVEYKFFANTKINVKVTAGRPHTIEAQLDFAKEEWKPGYYYIYTFMYWSDSTTENPETITLTTDKSLAAYYLRSKYAML